MYHILLQEKSFIQCEFAQTGKFYLMTFKYNYLR